MIELRVDTFNEAGQIARLVESLKTPCIITCRPEWEGGRSTMSDRERIDLLDWSTVQHAAYLDIELKTLRQNPKLPARQIIASSHDFAGRPDRLNNIVLEMNQSTASINKVVWTASTVRDNLEAFEILQNRARPTIALCMGEAGIISRILAKKFAGFLTFASLSKPAETAPTDPGADPSNLWGNARGGSR